MPQERHRDLRGQALLEWIIFGFLILVVWTVSMRTASRLLSRVTAESWGWLGARQALSQARTINPPGSFVRKWGTTTSGSAQVRVGEAHVSTKITLNQNAGPSLFRLFSSGFQSLRSSE